VNTTKVKISYKQRVQNTSFSSVLSISEKSKRNANSAEEEDESRSSDVGKSDKIGFFEDLFQI
jgi:hypothetical protein